MIKCPNCGSKDEKNYIGFNVVECVNPKCSSFKAPEDHLELKKEELKDTGAQIETKWDFFKAWDNHHVVYYLPQAYCMAPRQSFEITVTYKFNQNGDCTGMETIGSK